ncbi:Phox homologous domain-containing protein [Dimargaris cristalligena]|uniref:Phox homologous domain-containing protein n=1 Tax=Dimargaris cristalligena TaxID=215637 RepID=A0A4P9ZT23_9FUNG|nr:Phox homologous domain-containing protein [Dimargaris cristalligena]|eukprot:RKP36736.1 Phox homologous domain-containing protein [Dimargaris cristalligena]
MENIRNIQVPRYRRVKTPEDHVQYQVLVQAAVRSWHVWRRYSDFEALHGALQAQCPNLPAPPEQLPPKSWPQMRPKLDARREGLEKYLRAILHHSEPGWRASGPWGRFLEIPELRHGCGDPLWTAQSWSDEFRQLAALNREVRNILLKRDLGSSRNEVAVVHQCTLRAKQLLADTGARGLALERGLRALANAKLISEGEERRRHDALVTWRDELNQLNLQESYQQNAQRHDQLVNHGRTTSASTRSTRIFGNITSSSGGGIGGGSREARETEETKGLANSDLLTLQRDRMATQDGQLQQFSQILRRQNQLGTAIGDELDIQNQLLSEFSEDLDRTGTKLNNARKQLNRF